jgi:hypothetical protein
MYRMSTGVSTVEHSEHYARRFPSGWRNDGGWRVTASVPRSPTPIDDLPDNARPLM